MIKASNGWNVLDWIVLAVVVDVVLAVMYCDWVYNIAEWWGYVAR